jgi:phosphoribosylformylglycinamidine synthase
MPYRLEITLKPDLLDAEGESIRKKTRNYFGIDLVSVRTIQIITIDASLTPGQLSAIQTDIFTNPVTQISAWTPLLLPFDWAIWVGLKPGVRDNPGSTAVEAIEDVLGMALKPGEAIYTSRRYCIQAEGLTREHADTIAASLLANDIIQQWQVYPASDWDPSVGVGFRIPRVQLNHQPAVAVIPIDSDRELLEVSKSRNLALNVQDIPVIREYFLGSQVRDDRAQWGLSDPTDIELEYISQGRSDHCNHNTFRGLFHYRNLDTGDSVDVDNLFKTCIEAPTLELKRQKPWVVSVLWDNAGAARFDDDHYYVITGETHNSPSNMEAYGGAITGIVGVYRDPLGTGKGARLIMGSYGFCVGDRNYAGDLKPHLHPRRLLDGIIEGVRDGGNKSGIPTTFGQTLFHPGYMGKCLVFVTALGIMPARILGQPAEEKQASPGDLVIMCGGRVGKDGIHGVTASSEVFSEHTPAGHVQIGDPYTQKKMHDFLLEARDLGFIQFITDNGGGGLSSSIGESARSSNGCHIQLEKVPLKYEGLDQWEIWISESQERMTLAVKPEHLEAFMALSRRHAVESTVIGVYTDSGKLHITYEGKTCAWIDLNLLSSGFPQWEFDADWRSPEARGLYEPVLREPGDYEILLLEMMSRPNLCSKEWITRQYDHEVQGSSVVKPLTGRRRDINSDASVIRPVLTSQRGIAFTQALLPLYSQIDAYAMTACTIDEAVRRLIAVGADPEQIGGVDNFCWPSIQYYPVENPDGRFKAAQLVRSCLALRDMCLAYRIPLLSGKDSMYVDGYLPGKYGEIHKVSALETLQFSASAIVPDILRCATLEPKAPGDWVYILGMTRNELGGSEYYDHLGYVGLNVPQVVAGDVIPLYQALSCAISQRRVASCHGVYSGGLAVHLALTAMAADLGMTVNLSAVPVQGAIRNDQVMFSESAGRFIVTVSSDNQDAFETLMRGQPFACIGQMTESSGNLEIRGMSGAHLTQISVERLYAAWKMPFGALI